MRSLALLLISSLFVTTISAQESTTNKLQETARNLMQQGDLENAISILETAARKTPGNLEIMKDLSYACYLKRDFARAVEIAQPLVERADADQQTFQILGLCYKAIAAYKEAGKLYKTALKKFPASAVIYNEYGELMAADNNLPEAISQWEKGIQADQNYSSNYYNACIYYTKTKNWLRVLLYGEIFVNLESFTDRTTDVKTALVNAWQKLCVPAEFVQMKSANGLSSFEQSILTVLQPILITHKEGFSVANSTVIRSKWVLSWFAEKAIQYPFRLFDQQQYLLKEGMFEAYNQWIFGQTINESAYQVWQKEHPKEVEDYKKFQTSRVFKIPSGQYYFKQ